jgi:hypothetical protein
VAGIHCGPQPSLPPAIWFQELLSHLFGCKVATCFAYNGINLAAIYSRKVDLLAQQMYSVISVYFKRFKKLGL